MGLDGLHSPSSPGTPLRSPRSPGAMAADERLRARLEASSVGLEELNLLRQVHCSAIKMVKSMLMANIPEEAASQIQESPQSPLGASSSPVAALPAQETEQSVTDIPVITTTPPPHSSEVTQEEIDLNSSHHCAPKDLPQLLKTGTSGSRKRASSMDISMARSMALKAKKLRSRGAAAAAAAAAKTSPPSSHSTAQQEDRPPQGYEQRRQRSSSFSVEEKGVPKTMSIKERTRQSLQDQEKTPDSPACEAACKSLSGSFFSLGLAPPASPRDRGKSFHFHSYSMDDAEPLTESDFNSHFKSARSLSGSTLTYEFPSPMHAILLHYDKTEKPVLSEHLVGGDQSNVDDPSIIKMRRASFSGPVGRRASRQETSTYKLRKDSSLGDLPTYSNIHRLPVPAPTIDACAPSKSTSSPSVHDQDKGQDEEDISSFIEMLASRGLAKKRQLERERRERMIQALNPTATSSSDSHRSSDTDDTLDGEPSGDEVTARDVSSSLRSNLDGSGDGDVIMTTKRDSSSPQEHDSGQWEQGSCISGISNSLLTSASGKRGSHVSIRSSVSSASSASSKASLCSSEEGYFSHPGSPQNKHNNNRFSIQSASSIASAGSLSIFHSECSDDDILATESPKGGKQQRLDLTIPECDTSMQDTCKSPGGSIEILNLNHSPGARRRHSAYALSESDSKRLTELRKKDKKASSASPSKPAASTPLNKSLSASKPELNVSPIEIFTPSKVSRAKSSSPINVVEEPKAAQSTTALSASPKQSFLSTFEERKMSSTRDKVHSNTISPHCRKDSQHWGAAQTSGAQQNLPPWRQTSQQSEPGTNNTLVVRSRFECPRTPTIKEEPFKEEELTEIKATPFLQLTISPARDNIVPLSPPICNAPKVPSWRKQSKVSQTSTDENTPVQTEKKKPTPTVTEQKDKDPQGSDRRKSKSPKHVGHVTGGETKSENGSKSESSTKSEKSPKTEKLPTAPSPISSEQKLLTITKPDIPSVIIGATNNSPANKTSPNNVPVIKIHACPTLKTVEGQLMKSPAETPSFMKFTLKPTKGRERLSKSPAPDALNVFQYPSPIGTPKASSSKTPSSQDIQEMLKTWVEARTPDASATCDNSNKDDAKAVSKYSSLPRGFQTPSHYSQYLTPNVVEPIVATDNSNTLRQSKRKFRSQEICPKPVVSTAPTVQKPDPSDSHKAGARRASMPFTNITAKDTSRIAKSSKDSGVSSKPNTSPTALAPQPRPRSSTWSRGQPGPTSAGRKENHWVRETIIPPSTPTCKVEARIYEGGRSGRQSRPKSSSSAVHEQSIYPQVQWFGTCKEIKDTFV